MNRGWLRAPVLASSLSLVLAALIPAIGPNTIITSRYFTHAAPAPAADGGVVGPGYAPAVGEWQFNPATQHYYAQVDGLTWAEAEAYAVRLGGHLVTINDQAEQDWLMAAFGGEHPLAIGFNDLASEGSWVWSSGEPVTYTDWVPGQPDNFTGGDPAGQNNAAMNWTNPFDGVVGWDDGGEVGRALIEVRAVPTPVVTPTAKPTPTPTPKPTPTPTATPSPTTTPASGLVVQTTAVRSMLIASVTDLDHVTGSPEVIGTNLALALILLLAIGLTSALFNATLEENRSEIEGWFGRVSARASFVAAPLVKLLQTSSSGLPHNGRAGALGRVATILFLTALIYGFLSPDFGLDGRSLVVFISLLAGLGIVTYLAEGGSVLISSLRLHVPAGIRIYGAALAIAIGSVVISRVIDFKPGVLYGFVASAVLLAPGTLGRRQRAEMVLVPTVLLLAASLAAWLLLVPLRAAGASEDSWVLGLLEAVAAIVFVAGLESAFFNLIPIDFMDGATIARWNPLVWGVVFGLSGFLFWHLLLNQNQSYLAAFAETKVIAALVVAALFSIATVAIWTYFQISRRRFARSNT